MKTVKLATVGLSTALLACLTSGTALAGASSFAEMRGYKQCLSAAENESRGLVADRIYLLEQRPGRNEYFINASRWESGERASVRINCETTRNGRRLLAHNIAAGQYRQQGSNIRIEVAGK